MSAEAVRTHRVDELRFELAFPTERAALDGTARWETWLADRLLPIASEVFDEFSRPGAVRRLAALSVDLGELRASSSDAELERRAREALRTALQRALREAGATETDAALELTHRAADLEALTHFLRHGTLPWSAQGGDRGGFDALFCRVLDASGSAFVAWWRGAAHDPRVARRLAHQAPPEVLSRLAALLAPGRETFLVAVVAAVERLLSAPEIARGRDGARATAWEAVLAAATASASGVPAPGVFARQVLVTAARLRAGEGEGADRTLAAIAAHLEHAAVPEPDPGGALHALKAAARPSVTPDVGATDRGRTEALWHATLDRAVLRGDPRAVRNAWPMLVREQAALVLAVVRLRGRLARVRRRLADGFTEPMLGDVVHLLEPLHAGFIVEIVHRPELFQAAPPPAPGPEALRRRLWEFTLGYLLVERGGRFNKHDYLASLLRQRAAHDNVAYGDLVQSLVGLLEVVTAPSALQGEMLGLLRELLQRRQAVPSWTSEGAVRLAEAETYDVLVNRGGGAGAREARRKALAAAGDVVPEAWARFRAALAAAGESGLPPMLEGWTERELAALVETFVRSAPGGSAAGAQLLCASVVMRVPRGAGRRRHALMHVVSALARRAPVDVEAIVSSLAERDAGLSAQALRARVAAWLEGAADPGVPQLWSAWRQRRARDLRAVLLDRGRDASVRQTLAARAPEPLLVDVVHLVAPEAVGFVAATVRDPEAFRTPASAGRSVQETRRDLWLFTLGYLLAERGSGFNRRSYLASLLRQQAAHENRSVQVLARALLAVLEAQPRQDAMRRELAGVLHALLSEARPRIVDDARPRRAVADRATARDARASARAEARREAAEQPVDAVARWLNAAAGPSHLDRRAVREAFQRALRDRPQALLAMLRPHLERRTAIRRLAALLPESVLVGLLLRLRPEEAPAILRHADALTPAIVRALAEHERAGAAETVRTARVLRASARATARRTWRFLLAHLFREGRAFDPVQFAPALVRWWHRRAGVAMSGGTVTRLLHALRDGPFTRERLDALADALAMLNVPALDGSTGAAESSEADAGMRAVPRVSAAELRALDDARAEGASTGDAAGDLGESDLARARGENRDGAAHRDGRVTRDGTARDGFADRGRTLGRDAAGGAATSGARAARGDLDTARSGDRASDRDALRRAVTRDTKKGDEKRDEIRPRDATPVNGPEPEAITVTDAGQVLAAPYLPRLFSMLDLVADNAFVSPEAAHRAVHVLQFLVFGTTGAPESELALGKLLCGVPLDEPIPRDLSLAPRETDAVEGLLRGMIQNWKAVGNTSVAGLRETFLQREGRLVREDEAWRLTVAPRAFDMLIDRLPWGYSIIRHPWMPAMLQVDWR